MSIQIAVEEAVRMKEKKVRARSWSPAADPRRRRYQ